MNEITKFIWYYSGGNYIEVDNHKMVSVNMKKKYMKEWAKKLGVKFIDRNKETSIAKDVYYSWKRKSEKEKEEYDNNISNYCVLTIPIKVGYDEDVRKGEIYNFIGELIDDVERKSWRIEEW